MLLVWKYLNSHLLVVYKIRSGTYNLYDILCAFMPTIIYSKVLHKLYVNIIIFKLAILLIITLRILRYIVGLT